MRAHTVFSSASLTISGTMTINSGITVTNNGTVTASNLGAATGTWLQNASTAVLNYSGSSITPTLTATASGNTVNYNAGGAQTVKQTNYYDLQLSNSGTKTFASGTTGIAGNMTFGGTATADATTNSTNHRLQRRRGAERGRHQLLQSYPQQCRNKNLCLRYDRYRQHLHHQRHGKR